MSILRLIVAWLLMAALPMQGFAAATMQFCDQAAHSTAQQRPSHDHASPDHAAHGHGSHHAVADQAGAGVDLDQGGHDGPATASAPSDGHACPICASCCNLVALSDAPSLRLDEARPLPPPLQGPTRVTSREAPAPDKPPRA